MDTDLRKENILMRLRAKLNEDQVKLWELPYYDKEGSSNDHELKNLAKKYADILDLTVEEIFAAVKDLQSHSLERLQANNAFKETGVATLRIKVPSLSSPGKNISLKFKLSVCGEEIISAVAREITIEDCRVKLIHAGRVLKHDSPLNEQGIKNGSQLLAVVLSDTPASMQREGDLYVEMKKTRDDATLLSKCQQDDGGQYLQLEDQSGNAVELPAHEKRSLMVAMALHDKGRAAIRREDYSLALVLLLEADRLFSESSSSLLLSADNVALLQLDICWCYLLVSGASSGAIPGGSTASDAAARLARADAALGKLYGNNLERLIALKGTEDTINEQAQMMRLHLLQAIVLYHQNMREPALKLLDRAEGELRELKVDDEKLATLLELGYTAAEARYSLRASRGGTLQQALDYANTRRKLQEEKKTRIRDERDSKKLGHCDDGKQYVSASFVKMLESMGFMKSMAVAALRKTNNHVSNAVALIQEQPDVLALAISSSSSSESMSSVSGGEDNVKADKGFVKQLVGMGYDYRMAQAALKQCNNNIETAIDILVINGGYIDGQFEDLEEAPSTSSHTPKKRDHNPSIIQRRAEELAAFNRLSTGIRDSDDEEPDLILNKEESILLEYKTMLRNL